MGRRKQVLESDLTVEVVRGGDEAADAHWYRAMALLLHPKWDSDNELGADVLDTPATNAGYSTNGQDELTARLDMACGL